MFVTAPSPRLLNLDDWVTIAEGAEIKGVSQDAFRMWIRLHPTTLVCRVGRTVLVRKSDLEKYVPQGQKLVTA